MKTIKKFINLIKKKFEKLIDSLINLRRDRGQKIRFIKDGTYSFFINVGGNALSMLTGILLVRSLGVSQYGIYSYVLSLIYTLIIPVEFGIPNLIVRETARARARKEPEKIRGIWQWSVIVALIVSVIMIIGAILVAFLGRDILDQSDIQTLIWGTSIVLLLPMLHIVSAALRGLKHVVIGSMGELIFVQGMFNLFLIVVILFPIHFTSAMAMVLRALAILISLIIIIVVFIRVTPKEIFKTIPQISGKAWLLSAIPFGLSSGMNVIKKRVSLLILGFFAASSQVGIYQVAVRTATLAAMMIHMLNTIFAPYFASYFAKGEMKKLQRLAETSAIIGFLFAIASTIIYVFFGKFLLRIVFGPELIASYVPLLIMLIGQLINSFTGSVTFLLNMTGHEKQVLWVLGVSALFNVVINLIFTPIWGINGAALATSLSLILTQILMWFIVKKRIGIDSSAFSFFVKIFRRETNSQAE